MDEEQSDFGPDVPTFAEAGYGISLFSSRRFEFPADTPEEIITMIATAIGEITAIAELEEKVIQQVLVSSFKDYEKEAPLLDRGRGALH